MQEMKIKIKNPEHSKAVQEALFAKGCKWADDSTDVRCTSAKALYVHKPDEYHDSYYIMWSSADNRPEGERDETAFEYCDEPEYHLNHKGEFVEGPEPTLKEKLQAKIDETTTLAWDLGWKPDFTLVRRSDNDWDIQPVGLRPRKEVRQERIKEILEAMLRYAEVSMTIPDDWIDELVDIHEILKHEN